MTDAARTQAIDALDKAVARVLELGLASHPLAESLMARLDAGAITMRVVVDVGPEMTVSALAVPVDGGEVLEIFRVGPGTS